ncbi:ABC transporter ATP-binding protein [Methylobacterium organophilum]|uniref:ABC transporter ATP-binding protein n=1 Tax=Methylobacterium organophilum TaxID=410 RepID=A0ABQ4T1Q0_METOR|nr:ABC transporter ATP-binding protein [Methylobacterium organophilum]GJE25533.1 putative ABC transporter ATP-binding protein [Methylobacterium organophilum]
MLSVEGLSFGYPGRTVGRDVSFALKAGEVLCLLGPNGGGKTTLFKTVLGLLPAQAGRVSLDGQDIARWSRAQVARALAYVPQAHAAFFPFSVREVVLMGRASRLPPFASPGPSDHAAAEQALARLGIGHLAGRIYTEISGGERQMALIARALAGEPRILVMDEPTASLDFGNQARVLSQVRRLAARGIAVILSTHDPGHAFLCADRVLALHEGRLAAAGPPAETVTPEILRRLYGVEVTVAPLPGGLAACAPVLS